jgi:hypothetical protein
MQNLKKLKFSNDGKTLIGGIACCIIFLSFLVYAYTIPAPEPKIFPLWLVEPNGAIPNATMPISIGVTSSLSIGAQNRMGQFEYCSILVKLRDLSSSIPFSGNASDAPKPSSLKPIMNLDFSLEDKEIWESPFSFNFQTSAVNNESYTVGSVIINGQSYTLPNPISSQIIQTPYYQFLYELWTKNASQTEYSFSGIWVSSPFLIANQTVVPNASPTPTSTRTPSPTSTSSPFLLKPYFQPYSNARTNSHSNS